MTAGALLLAAGLGAASGAAAQTFLERPNAIASSLRPGPLPPDAPGSPELRARQQALLDQTIRNPLDFDATYAYVDVSIRLGDSEAAIGALERLVNYNPKLSRAQYELGRLYYGLGSFDAAERYLRLAGADPLIEPMIRARVEALYPDAVKQQSPSRWSGTLQTGLRYQSNATFIPSSGGIVRVNGQDLFLSPADRRRSDGSVFGLAEIGHDYDLQNQRGDVLETRFLGYGSKQFDATGFDFGFVEASFGPRFGLPELGQGASIKPYVVGQTSFLRRERSPYISSGGGGVTLRLPVLANLTLDAGVEGRALSVNGRDAFQAATFDSGQSVTGYLLSSLKLTPDIELEGRFVGLRAESKQPWQSFTKGGAAVALGIQFEPPSPLIARKWKVSPFISGAILEFDRANPAIDPRVVRHDREFSTGIVLDAPLTGMFSLSALIQYERIESSLPNYRQHGVTVLGGPTARF